MADLSAIFQALTNANTAAQKSSPYADFTNLSDQIGNVIVQQAAQRKASTQDAILAGLLTGLVGGGAQNLTNSYVTKQDSLARDVLASSLAGNEMERPTGMSPSVFSGIQNAGTLFQGQRALDIQDEQRKLEQQKDLSHYNLMDQYSGPVLAAKHAEQDRAGNIEARKALLSAMAQADTPQKQAQLVAAAQSMGVLPDDFKLVVPDRKPVASTLGQYSRGVEGTLLDQMNAEIQAQVDSGISPSQASMNVRKVYDDRVAQLDRQYKSIEDAEKAGNDLSALSGQLRNALQRAGNTGFGGQLAQTTAGLAGLVSSGQRDKYAAGQDVESFRKDAVGIFGRGFKGPMSDRDVKIMLSSAPSLGTEEATNDAILSRWDYVANLQKAYATFMRDQQDRGVPVSLAEKRWSAIKNENPYTIQDVHGKYYTNPAWEGGSIPVTLNKDVLESNPAAPLEPSQPKSEMKAPGDGFLYRKNPATGLWDKVGRAQ